MPSKVDEKFYKRPVALVSTKIELKELFDIEYLKLERARSRFYKDESNNIIGHRSGKKVLIPNGFIAQLKDHIIYALKHDLIDQLMYSDMGHGHLYIKDNEENEKKKTEELLNNEDLKILYHTAELFDLNQEDFPNHEIPTDPWLLRRYETRNLLTDQFDKSKLVVLPKSEESFNTVREVAGHRSFGTIYIIPNIDGCFNLKSNQKNINFDLSFFL